MPLLFNIILEILAREIKQKNKNKKNKNKDIHIKKEQVKLCPFADDTILYRENTKDPTKKSLLELKKHIQQNCRI